MSDSDMPRRGFDGWRWGGRVFLVLLLAYTLIPMAWMLITSLKTGFAAMQYPPQWWPAEPTLEKWRAVEHLRQELGRARHVVTAEAREGLAHLGPYQQPLGALLPQGLSEERP